MEPLDPVEVRVLGSLVEKEITTPEYYPLTLNALVNACNQKSNRDPAVAYDEDTVSDAIDRLRHRSMVGVLTGGSNRVPKFNHRLWEALNIGRREVALLCELMLRGPQTSGELKDRAGRMHRFSDLDEVEACLAGMSSREPEPLTVLLSRQAGRKEPRHAHLLSGAPDVSAEPVGVIGKSAAADSEGRVEELEKEMVELRAKVADLEQQWLRFRQQFE